VHCQKRPELTIRFRFPEIPDDDTKQTRRNTDIFNSDSTLRQTARNAVVEPFVEAISIWRDSNGNMNMSTEGGWEQANVGFYSTLTLTYQDPSNKEKFEANWYAGTELIPVIVQPDGSWIYTPPMRVINLTKDNPSEINVYFVRGLREVAGEALLMGSPTANLPPQTVELSS